MGYEHSLNGRVVLKQAQKIEVVKRALGPLAGYFNWNFKTDTGLELIRKDGLITEVVFTTTGEVGYSFCEQVEDCLANFTELAEPGYITLSDHDTGCLEEAQTEFWFGNPDEVEEAQKRRAIVKAQEELKPFGLIVTIASPDAANQQYTLTAAQKLLLHHYLGGEFDHLSDSIKTQADFDRAKAESGDGLLNFLLDELASSNDCTDLQIAYERLFRIADDISTIADRVYQAI